MCDFFILDHHGSAYPMYYIIYTKNGSDDIFLEYNNFLINNITNRGIITVNLTDIFSEV
jgi:hypothetical protein